MDGIQKTVSLGLQYLANKVAEGAYGNDDEAFENDLVREAFLEDLQDEVLDKMD